MSRFGVALAVLLVIGGLADEQRPQVIVLDIRLPGMTGCHGYLAKPIRYPEFLAQISAALHGRAPSTLISQGDVS